MGRHTLVATVVVLLLTGCAGRLNGGPAQQRLAVLRACSQPALIAKPPRNQSEMRVGLRRVEACMAVHNLAGHATYIAATNSVRFTYDKDRPSIHF